MEQRLKEIIVEVITAKGVRLIEPETMPDHVHLLVHGDVFWDTRKVRRRELFFSVQIGRSGPDRRRC
ncbi:hypothetical protein LAUMK13_05680 [Mycobacterium innocens]|uniref:Transposase IS200-like domain-containing protein n=1 Tax=Mycobacterium innocens TaxID=2341083 RepID=A0A498QH22_9MYCO|nr:hypothetical protein LAUMK13_05680 [Mycobacterium innocens]